MRVLVFDLETVPCIPTAVRTWGLNPNPDDWKTFAGSFYEAVRENRLKETEGKSDFAKPHMHRIVALGMVLIDTDIGNVGLFADASEDEQALIGRFHRWLDGAPVLVGWNSMGFDLPVLRYRALHHGLALPRLYGSENLRSYDKYDYRFGDRHYDLRDVLSGYGRSTSLKLSEMAALCGIDAKTQGSGEEVLTLFQAGELGRIGDYVGEDARVTARLFLRWQVSRGRLAEKMKNQIDAQLATVSPAPATLELGVA